MTIRNNIAGIKRLVELLPKIFQQAVDNIHVLPVFAEAASGGDETEGKGGWTDPNKGGVIGGAPEFGQRDDALNKLLGIRRGHSAEFSSEQYQEYSIK